MSLKSDRELVTAYATANGWTLVSQGTWNAVFQRGTEELLAQFAVTKSPFAETPPLKRVEVYKLRGDESHWLGDLTGLELVLDYLSH